MSVRLLDEIDRGNISAPMLPQGNIGKQVTLPILMCGQGDINHSDLYHARGRSSTSVSPCPSPTKRAHSIVTTQLKAYGNSTFVYHDKAYNSALG